MIEEIRAAPVDELLTKIKNKLFWSTIVVIALGKLSRLSLKSIIIVVIKSGLSNFNKNSENV